MLGKTNAQSASLANALENTAKYPDTALTVGGYPTEWEETTNFGIKSNVTKGGASFGYYAGTNTCGSAFGNNAQALGKLSVAFGFGAEVNGDYSIILGQGRNTERRTFKVAIPKGDGAEDYAVDEATGLYTVIDTDGNIPLERLKLVTDQIGDVSTLLDTINGEIV